MNLKLPRMLLASAVDRLGPIVPTRPRDPVHGQFRLAVEEDRLTVDATDGAVRARVVLPGVEGEGSDVLPAAKFTEMVRLIPEDDEGVTLDTSDRTRAVLQTSQVHFTFPLHANTEFPPFPEPLDEGDPARFNTDEFVSALARVSYAMGGPEARPNHRMVRVADGSAVAFSGRRAQEAVLENHGEPAEVLIPDAALAPLIRFLRASGQIGVTEVWTAVEHEGMGYTVLSCGDGWFAFPPPAVPFVDLSNIWKVADEQRGDADALTAERASLLYAIRLCRVQADPKQPVLVLDVGPAQVRAWSRVDDANRVEVALQADYAGEEDRKIAVSLDDVEHLVEACAETQVRLLLAAPKHANGRRRPLVQVEDTSAGRPARSLIPQTEVPA